MDPSEASSFETSEIFGSFLLSTQLFSESWKRCLLVNTASPGGFVVELSGDGVGYVAFSGIQGTPMQHGVEDLGFDRFLVRLDDETCKASGMFSPLMRDGGGGGGSSEEPVLVHPGVLRLFLSVYARPDFQSQMSALLEKCQSIVFTGHSVGGSIASLAALWLLSYTQSVLKSNPSVELTKKYSTLSILCITFGSPLLGNASLSRAILRERWRGSFCHVISKNDPVPRLLTMASSLHDLLLCGLSSDANSMKIPEEVKAAFLAALTSSYVKKVALIEDGSGGSSFRPFGSYLLCSEDGAICVDNDAMVLNQMKGSTLGTISMNLNLDDHFQYGEYIKKLSAQFLMSRKRFKSNDLVESSYEAGITLSLRSWGTHIEEPDTPSIGDSLKLARRMGRQAPNLNSANLVIRLARITPYRAEIEWYKSYCDNSGEQMGYYDSFKGRQASKREAKVNMNRFKLAAFWNDLIRMLEKNELPHDFHRSSKWVNASQFYKLLVEPLDIADYYRSGMHRVKGHYVEHGREKRYEIFDRWWNEKCATNGDSQNRAEVASRTRYACLTQDSLFWARVEEARDWLDQLKVEVGDPRKQRFLWERLNEFELYVTKMVHEKKVSEDVLAKNSSFMAWTNEWMLLKSQWKKQNFLPNAAVAGNLLA